MLETPPARTYPVSSRCSTCISESEIIEISRSTSCLQKYENCFLIQNHSVIAGCSWALVFLLSSETSSSRGLGLQIKSVGNPICTATCEGSQIQFLQVSFLMIVCLFYRIKIAKEDHFYKEHWRYRRST